MRLVFLNQYYPPDAAPTGVMLASVVEELVAQGHEVTVICSEGGYAGRRHKTQEKEGEKEVESLKVEGRKSEEDRPCGALVALDGVGRMREDTPTVIRIGATRFGRGTWVGKLLDYFSYYLGVAWRLAWMWPRPERIVALTTPPYLSVLARVISKFREADHAHWVMDLYPDVMVAHGMLREGSGMHRILSGLARWGMGGSRCAAVLTLGPDMAERVGGRETGEENIEHRREEKEVESLKVEGRKSEEDPPCGVLVAPDEVGRPRPSDPTWIPLWGGVGDGDGLAVANRRHEMGWADDELVVMYSGNMGLGHRFEEILEVIGKMEESIEHRSEEKVDRPRPSDSTRHVFFGEGRRRGEIAEFMARHPGAPAELHDYASAEILSVHLRSADVHLVTLDEKWTGTMVPSKLQGIFAAGRPVIFIGDARSSIGRWVIESGGGWVVVPGDVAGLEDALQKARCPAAREACGRAAAEFAAAHFDRQTNVRKVAEVLVQGGY